MRHNILCFLASLYEDWKDTPTCDSITASSRTFLQATQADLKLLTEVSVDEGAGLHTYVLEKGVLDIGMYMCMHACTCADTSKGLCTLYHI